MHDDTERLAFKRIVCRANDDATKGVRRVWHHETGRPYLGVAARGLADSDDDEGGLQPVCGTGALRRVSDGGKR